MDSGRCDHDNSPQGLMGLNVISGATGVPVTPRHPLASCSATQQLAFVASVSSQEI